MSLFTKRLLRTEAPGLGGKLWRVSWLYVLLLCLLAGVGYVALYSADGGSALPYAGPHLLRFGFALLLMLGIAMIDIRVIARLSWAGYAVGLVFLAAVLRFGNVGNGARRWLSIGSFQWQPSEMMKIVLVLALAAWFRRASWERMGNPLFLIPPALATLVPVALILKEPNLGTAVIVAAIGAAVFLGAGLRWWKVALIAVVVVAGAPIVYHHLHAYQRARIEIFLHPELDPLGAGYNILQSKIALGSGGIWGKGFLHGTQGQLDFLPEKQTDFIFTVLAEEFGLVGSYVVLGLLMLITFAGLAIALRCRHQFGRLVALGLTMNFFCYVFVNLAMVMGLIPVGGVPLPLISHGGSAMIMVMIGCGILMSVHVHRDAAFGEPAEAT